MAFKSGGGLVRVVAGKVIINQQPQQGTLPETSAQPVFIDVMLAANETVELAFKTDNTAVVFVYKGATDLVASRHLGVYGSGNIL
jgi:redox-sensitive bicupin YhaK (pirin superfamily)